MNARSPAAEPGAVLAARPGRPIWLWTSAAAAAVLALSGVSWWLWNSGQLPRYAVAEPRREVVFWHFWGGADRAVVEQIVERFNAHQTRWRVRAVAMPGNNLDLKVFLSVAGGSPPDLINQDDPILADWALRGALEPLDSVAAAEELEQLDHWLFPAAAQLARYEGRYYALPNGLDIRALYYNRSWLEEAGVEPPRTLEQLDRLAAALTEYGEDGQVARFGYVPDPRRLWAWGFVFGGDFYDESQGRITAADPRIVAALEWMGRYRQQFGARQIAAFRQGDQSLPGAAFPLFPATDSVKGRYAMIMDGQWRVRDIAAWQAERQRQGGREVQFGVLPLPPPRGGRERAGWVNGNFFLLPRGGKNAEGAWEFMKFWSGFGGHETQAAAACAAGGWIPVSQDVVRQPEFQRFLDEHPLFRPFVALAASPHQRPLPIIPAAAAYDRNLRAAATMTMYDDQPAPAETLLSAVEHQTQQALERALERRSDGGVRAARRKLAPASQGAEP